MTRCGKAGWERVFKDAIFLFNNKLSSKSNHNLGVTFVEEGDRKKANVEVQASRGTVEIEYLPYLPKTTLSFNSTKVHGLNRAVRDKIKDKANIEQWKMIKDFIIVPAAPSGDRNGRLSPVGDGVKLVIAVHELIHACGLVHNDEHSVDDVFCWPNIRMGNKPSEDSVGTLGETYTFPGKPGEPPRVGHRQVYMPPIFLKKDTADKIRNLWA